MMQMYEDEKINLLSSRSPMLLQTLVSIGPYWTLFASVELRQVLQLGWTTNLSRPDPFYTPSLITAGMTFVQIFLNPPPTDPVQTKMMKIMSITFSTMLSFFPAGLALHRVVNSPLTIAQ